MQKMCGRRASLRQLATERQTASPVPYSLAIDDACRRYRPTDRRGAVYECRELNPDSSCANAPLWIPRSVLWLQLRHAPSVLLMIRAASTFAIFAEHIGIPMNGGSRLLVPVPCIPMESSSSGFRRPRSLAKSCRALRHTFRGRRSES